MTMTMTTKLYEKTTACYHSRMGRRTQNEKKERINKFKKMYWRQ